MSLLRPSRGRLVLPSPKSYRLTAEGETMAMPTDRAARPTFPRGRPRFVVKRVLLPVAVFAPLVYLLPKLMLFYALCGAYDIARNRPVEAGLVRRYFFGNGIPTWLLSPFNIAMDLLTLPYLNKGVYRLTDLPPAYPAHP